MRKLVSFDFDDTLFDTPKPEDGKDVWKEKTGTEWPHKGWWGKAETLDMNIFDIKLNGFVHDEYLKYFGADNHVILATGRLDSRKVSLKNEVNAILDANKLSFDGVYLNTGIDTFDFKSRLFEKLIDEVKPTEFIMFDDREEHIDRFAEWAKGQKCDVLIYDVRRMITIPVKN